MQSCAHSILIKLAWRKNNNRLDWSANNSFVNDWLAHQCRLVWEHLIKSQTTNRPHCFAVRKNLICFCIQSDWQQNDPAPFDLPHNVCLSVGPILVVEPRPITVDVDSDVALNCKWSGNPPLTLTWTKKGSNMVQKQLSPPSPAKAPKTYISQPRHVLLRCQILRFKRAGKDQSRLAWIQSLSLQSNPAEVPPHILAS